MEIISINPSGFVKDLAPAETSLEVYNDADNVIFENGFATSSPGWLQTPGALLCQPLWLLPVFTPSIYYWIYGGNNDAETAGVLAVTDGVTHWDITPAGGLEITAAGDWTGGVLNGIPVVNNSKDVPMWWDLQTGNAAQTLPDWPANTTCKALRPFKFHLLAMNITQGGVDFPDLLLHSDAADPGAIPQSWTPASDNQAGSFSIATITGGIIDGAELRDFFIVYKQGSNAIVQYTGSSFVFSTRRLFVSTGMLAPNCAQEYQGQHYMITDGDIVRHDGQRVESLVAGALQNWIFDQQGSSSRSAHVAIDHGNKNVWFNFSRNGTEYCDISLVWDLVSQRMGVVDYAPFAFMARGVLGDLGVNTIWDSQIDTWDTYQGSWNESQFNPTNDQLLFVRYTEKQLNYLSGNTRGGKNSMSRLQLLSKDFGAPTEYKTIDRVYLNGFAGSRALGEAVTARIGSQEAPNDPIRWSPLLSLYRDKSFSYGVSGRLISIELNIDQQDAWRINSLDVHYTGGGV